MPDINISPIEEGDPITAASLNTRFTEIAAGVNGLPEYSNLPGAFNKSHLPVLVPASIGAQTVIIDNEVATDAAYIANAAYPVMDVITDGVDTLQMTWAGPVAFDMTVTPKIAGIMVLFNIQLGDFVPISIVEKTFAVFALEVYDGVAWGVLNRTIRFIFASPFQTNNFQDVSIRTLLSADDLVELGITDCLGVRAVAASYPLATDLDLYGANLSIIPLHAGVP